MRVHDARVDWEAEPGQTGTVENVEGASISLSGGWGFGWNEDAGPVPRVGDQVKVLGEFGHRFYGFVLNGRLVWYLTPEQREAERQKSIADSNARREREFQENETRLDADYEALPPVLRQRIEALRAAGGRDWRVHNESYEMFCCTEAVLIAGHFGSRDEIARWAAMPYGEQRAEWDGFSDQHSGNTFGAACSFAALLADDTAVSGGQLVATPAALSPISGDPRYRADDA